uniref:GMC oxidoreductase n=1 Tax=Candidatus Kentrum sp. LPFa TaxID=2126335 RepID=A0A450XLH3_9GAMM|nr:MAG: GMC oxidoreductase [Candidatus Kentron sp. LPFa]VFK30151.1 MAG: GMC oxidoreductase [Candidatus Kentron sp. LPFa]
MKYDVVIVGAGVAGALAAYSLAKNGTRILILKAGPWYPGRGELVQRMHAYPGSAPYPDHPETPRPTFLDTGYYIQTGPDIFGAPYERGVGGSTWHWSGSCPRLLPNDFKMQSRYGKAVDWAIDYEELEPWYCQAEAELGMAGDSENDAGSPRSQPYPRRPIPKTYLDKSVARAVDGSAFQGIPLKVESIPKARDPDRCLGSTSCSPLCPTGAKYEAIIHVRKAIDHGAIVREKSIASRLDVDESGRISSVEYLSWDGEKHRVTGRFYILAAHGIETAKLLLMSRSDTLPNGVANSSDQVGRNLMDHPVQVSSALTEKPVYPY